MSSGSFLIKFMVLALGIILISKNANGDSITLFDFTTVSNLDDWTEQSDTVRDVGKSKAAFILQTTQLFQRAILFTLLNLQSDGSGFAAVRTPVSLDLSAYANLTVTCRAQGNNTIYKIVLRHKDLIANTDPTYEQFFEVPASIEELQTVNVPLSGFKPYFRGAELVDGEALDTSNISIFGLQMAAGVYEPFDQSGVSSLEINTIGATS